jgi:diguanylate cyclase (GGDEF)-like protein/PAS domain S-box-containing protein
MRANPKLNLGSEFPALLERARLMFQTLPDIVWSIEVPSREVLYVSPAVEQIFGRAPEEFYANPALWGDCLHPADRVRLVERWSEAAEGQPWNEEYRIVMPDGEVRWLESRGRAAHDDTGKAVRIYGVSRDITARREQERRIVQLSRIHAVLSGINTTIARTRDRALLLREACRIAVEQGGFGLVWLGLLDRAANEVKVAAHHGFDPHGSADFAVAFGECGAIHSSTAWQAMTERRPVWSSDITQESARNSIRSQAIARGFRSAISLPLVTAGESVGILILFASECDFFDAEEVKLLTELAADISLALENIDKEEKLRFLARFDELTGLPNRALFRERLSQILASAKHGGTHTTMALADIKRFRQMNETFGREMGDALLREFARRLRSFWPEPENVARVGSDCFALALAGTSGVHDAAFIAATLEKYLKQTLAAPFAMGDKEIRISVATGVAVYPPDGEDADVLFRNAEAALKKGQASGERMVFYQPEMNARVAETLMLENRLHRAIEHEQFILHYQPKIESATGRVVGMEALIRWQDPDSGLVSPGEFIPILEETGMILEVGAWVIRKVLIESRAWRLTHGGPLRVAVNVSPVQLKQRDFVDSVRRAIDGSGIAGCQLDLELTESMIMDDIDENVSKLAALRDMGVDIAVDDFGTGHSSLAYLAKLPVNALKIDRSFVATMTINPHSMTLVSTIISLAHALDLKVIAEGVESEDQAKLLRLIKCDEMQGYLFSMPLPADRVVAFLRRADIPR